MKYSILSLVLCSLFVCGSAFAGGDWTDWFDDYANQSALEANWTAVSGFASGFLDNSRVLSATQSMKIEKGRKPTRALNTQGRFTIWVYDDGATPKQFDVEVHSKGGTPGFVALGLRDDGTSGNDQYTCNINGTVTKTGIPRTTGWHLFQYQINNADKGGWKVKLDGKGFPGNVPSLTDGDKVIINTEFGASGDTNTIWVDSARYNHNANADRLLSAVDETYILDYGFEKDVTNWTALPGTVN
ncbi:MAG TPA: hypothetical protein PKH07_14225, partial [bacterium]|nr:hypothetical protein [bacterium]